MTNIAMENDTKAKTVTLFVDVPIGGFKQANETANAQITFTADEFKAAADKKAFLQGKAAECAALVGATAFEYTGSLKSIMERY